jgi:hypothetical protein
MPITMAMPAMGIKKTEKADGGISNPPPDACWAPRAL